MFATLIGGLLAATMALLFDVDQLIDMMSIGTLIAYTIVAISVLILRYECDALASAIEIRSTNGQVWRQLLNLNEVKRPNRLSSTITKFGVMLFGVCSIMLCTLNNYLQSNDIDTLVLCAVAVVVSAMLLIILIIMRQPVSDVKLTFRVPLVPFIPCLSMLINLYLMFQLNAHTWIRLAVWCSLGKAHNLI